MSLWLSAATVAHGQWVSPTPNDSGNQGEGTNETEADMATIQNHFVLIKGGSFQMGSPKNEAWRGEDENSHEVAVSDFYLSRYEVTRKEYREIMGADPSIFPGDDSPAENITWFQAVAFCNAISAKEGLAPAYVIDGDMVTWNRAANGYRLPTEAEWEYACRAGTTTPFNTGNSIGPEEANYYGHYPYGIEENYFSQENLDTKPGQYRQKTVRVGSFPANKLNLHDTHGNVGEWVWDYYGDYGTVPETDPVGPSEGAFRVYRGGGWNDFAKNLRCAYRATMPPDKAANNIGLRLARNAVPGAGLVPGLVVPATATVGAATAGSARDGSGSDDSAGQNEGGKPGGKILIAYFSWGGNTRGIAEAIHKNLPGADLFELTPILFG
jgi:formylglycine-generating enzyme required for sulfatase activity